MIMKIYLYGAAVALIIEIVTALRIKRITPFILIGAIASWLWVIWFLIWVIDMMGRQYEDLKAPDICIWRIK